VNFNTCVLPDAEYFQLVLVSEVGAESFLEQAVSRNSDTQAVKNNNFLIAKSIIGKMLRRFFVQK